MKTIFKILLPFFKLDYSDLKLFAYAVAFVFVFLFSIETLKSSLHLLGQDLSNQIIGSTTNHFVALFIGILATVILQSSSTVTSALVGAVGSGIIDFEAALNMMMGANLGTTLTCMMISLSFMSKRLEFKRALEASLLHNIFNVFVILILFPLELLFGVLSKFSLYLTDYVYLGKASMNVSFAGISDFLSWLNRPLVYLISNPIILLLIAIFMIFGSIRAFGYFSKNRIFQSTSLVEQRVFGSPLASLFWGLGITALLQSSSLTTSLVIPLVASGRITVTAALPFVMGANVGTTLTALLASVSASETAVALAISHLLFNSIGVLLFYPLRPLRMFLIFIASCVGGLAFQHRIWGFIYLVMMFFVMPFILIYLTR